MECIMVSMAVDRMWVSRRICRIQSRFTIKMRKYLILFERMLICFHLDYDNAIMLPAKI